MLRVAIQSKSRLSEDCDQLFAKAGIKFESSKRQLMIQSANFPVEILFLEENDIAHSVEEGVADVGILNECDFIESGVNANVIYRLGFGQSRLSLAIPKEAKYRNIEWFSGKKIATSYPNILSAYFKQNKIRAKVQTIRGAVEIAPEIELSDAVFDVVYSGSTLLANRLHEVERVLESEAVVIAAKNLVFQKQTILDELMVRFKSVQMAESQKYLIMNIPNEKINEVVAFLPSQKSPTIVPLVMEGWSSIQTVVDERRFWDIIGRLKQCGAEDLLILPIQKLID